MQVMQAYINIIICFDAYKCRFDIHYLFVISDTPIDLFLKDASSHLNP